MHAPMTEPEQRSAADVMDVLRVSECAGAGGGLHRICLQIVGGERAVDNGFFSATDLRRCVSPVSPGWRARERHIIMEKKKATKSQSVIHLGKPNHPSHPQAPRIHEQVTNLCCIERRAQGMNRPVPSVVHPQEFQNPLVSTSCEEPHETTDTR
ncbi:hypothetical protein AXG93_2899s1230 [Marchantia polymorpha subsp. ruderalis]|uniref:Uncharacterized protein n=1 Tax=Marchantia polymorpha subsp. ruderalis TaxID=1480154 RepID=A0A176VB84_MARPO|nr:hypothetical protein AXG93_2899s1230 [Marchantia polymorpha subsp. ruderalis]